MGKSQYVIEITWLTVNFNSSFQVESPGNLKNEIATRLLHTENASQMSTELHHFWSWINELLKAAVAYADLFN